MQAVVLRRIRLTLAVLVLTVSAGSAAEKPAFTRTVPVRAAWQLKPALANARPGDDIVIAKGVYPGPMYFTVVGTQDKPIRIRVPVPPRLP